MDTSNSRIATYGSTPSGRRVPRKTALVLALVLALGVASTAVAGSGHNGVFNLGVLNTINSYVTTLAGSVAGKSLQVTNSSTATTASAIGANNKSTTAAAVAAANTGGGPALSLTVNAGKAPMKVNSAGKVANLNADRLDGLDSTVLQKRVAGTGPTGASIRVVNSNGTVTCEADDDSGGDITRVTAAAGLSGGAEIGDASLSVDFAGNGSASSAARSDHNHDAAYEDKYKSTVVVGPVGTPEQNGAALLSALSGITANVGNPRLLKIEPGTYNLGSTPLQMQEHLDVEGSGQERTLIKCACDNGALKGANNSELRFLAVENVGSNSTDLSIGVFNKNASPRMLHVSATASGGTFSYGVYNDNSSPTMTSVTATSSDAANSSHGIYNYYSGPTLTSVTATASGATYYNYGVHNNRSNAPTLVNVTATASGGTHSYGVFNTWSSPTMTDVSATGSGGTYSYGAYSESSSPIMNNVTASGSGGSDSNVGVFNWSSLPRMTNVTATGSGGLRSYGVWNETMHEGVTAVLTGVTAKGSGASNYNFGIFNNSSSVTIKNSTLIATGTDNYALYKLSGGTGTTRIVNSQIDGPVTTGITCFNNYNQNLSVVTCP